MDTFAESVMRSDTNRLVYFAVLLALLLLIVYHLRQASAGEHMSTIYQGTGLGTSGQTSRVLDQQFSSSNQDTGRNSTLTGHVAQASGGLASEVGFIPSGTGSEGLVNGGGYPDFWEINSELDAYKRKQSPHIARMAGQERLDNPGLDNLYNVEDNALGMLL